MTTTEQTMAPAPKKNRRGRRVQGPPGVRCSSCGKLAGAEDEGRVEDYSADISEGSIDHVSVDIAAALILVSACCGQDFKRYDLTDGTVEGDHECPKAQELEEAEHEYEEHCADSGKECGCSDSGPECDTGAGLHEAMTQLRATVENEGEAWEVFIDGEEDAAPYQRYQNKAMVKIRKGGKVVGYKEKPIRSTRYMRSFRGITTTLTVKHELCGEMEELSLNEGDLEAGAGDFEAIE